MLTRLPPERGHQVALWGLARGFGPSGTADNPPGLDQTIWGRNFANPVAVSAGFDKNAVAIGGTIRMGVGFAEVGGVTPRAQVGNPRPRLFRLTEDRAAINRLGFNNHGADTIRTRIEAFRSANEECPPLGVNLAANSDSTDPARDFETLVLSLIHI